LRGSYELDSASTLKLDVSANWTDPLDDGDNPHPEMHHVNAFVIDIPKGGIKGSKQNNITKDQHFEDTKHHHVRYHCVSTTRFKEYFPPPTVKCKEDGTCITRESEESRNPDSPDPQWVHILNCSPLQALKILYVIPTFKWTESKTGSGQSRKRAGGGLRVYMERPWYSTGDGELLGVILWPGQMSKYRLDKEPERYCTM
jgi:hypothetical protein